jgi:hypothetical protein
MFDLYFIMLETRFGGGDNGVRWSVHKNIHFSRFESLRYNVAESRFKVRVTVTHSKSSENACLWGLALNQAEHSKRSQTP